jgi:MSHA biogenesis protein MshJ
MVGVLQGMLSEDAGLRSGLRLVRLDTLPPEPVGLPAKDNADKTAPTAPAAANATEAAPLFKHGIQLTLVGNYASLTRYMEKLEHLPAGFYWARAELDANGHPEISLTLTLYTLSLEKTWLTV